MILPSLFLLFTLFRKEYAVFVGVVAIFMDTVIDLFYRDIFGSTSFSINTPVYVLIGTYLSLSLSTGAGFVVVWYLLFSRHVKSVYLGQSEKDTHSNIASF